MNESYIESIVDARHNVDIGDIVRIMDHGEFLPSLWKVLSINLRSKYFEASTIYKVGKIDSFGFRVVAEEDVLKVEEK